MFYNLHNTLIITFSNVLIESTFKIFDRCLNKFREHCSESKLEKSSLSLDSVPQNAYNSTHQGTLNILSAPLHLLSSTTQVHIQYPPPSLCRCQIFFYIKLCETVLIVLVIYSFLGIMTSDHSKNQLTVIEYDWNTPLCLEI